MTTVEMNLTEDEKKALDNLGLTDGNEIKSFIFRKINEDNIFPSISSSKKTKKIVLTAGTDGSLIVPDDAPEHIKEWVEYG